MLNLKTTSTGLYLSFKCRCMINIICFSFFAYSYLRSRDLLVLQVPLNQFLGDGLPAVLPSLRWSSGCSFPYWFPFKCDAWQSSLFHYSHVSVLISFSLSSPTYDVLHPTYCSLMSVFLSVCSCFSHYSPERFHFGYSKHSFRFVGFYPVCHGWPDTGLIDPDLAILSHVRSPILSAFSSPTRSQAPVKGGGFSG